MRSGTRPRSSRASQRVLPAWDLKRRMAFSSSSTSNNPEGRTWEDRPSRLIFSEPRYFGKRVFLKGWGSLRRCGVSPCRPAPTPARYLLAFLRRLPSKLKHACLDGGIQRTAFVWVDEPSAELVRYEGGTSPKRLGRAGPRDTSRSMIYATRASLIIFASFICMITIMYGVTVDIWDA